MPNDSAAAPAVADKALHYYAHFDAQLRQQLKGFIDDALIAEHAANPHGQHSDKLERLLNYFRRAPAPGKYIIVAVKPWEEYRIGLISGVRGRPPELLDGPVFRTEDEALHGIFLQRVKDLQAS